MREEIEQLVNQPDTCAQGYADLKEILRTEPTLKNYQFAHRLVEAVPPPASRDIRVALLSSYTIDFVTPLLKAELFLSDLAATIYKPHFNQFRQEILNPTSALYAFKPDVVFVGFTLEDVFPDAVGRFAALSQVEREDLRQGILSLCASLKQAFHEYAPAASRILIQNFVPPYGAYDGLVRGLGAIQTFVDALNADLGAGPDVFDYARLVSQSGARGWTDPRTYYMARIPVAQHHWVDLAKWYGRYVRAVANTEVKCIILDLDNTLWGGVLGEDGFDGLRMGDTYPGIAFKRLQEYLLALHANGYILAVSSKNDLDDVVAVLRRHPHMVLRESHFAAIEANWNEKTESIRAISKEIQISFDHMLFVDDNPVELAKVRAAIPGIQCLHLQSPPIAFVSQFDERRCFAKLLVTDEDGHRGRQYFEERQRRTAKQSTGSLEEFYRGLDQRLTVHVNHQTHVTRIAQLTQRTNQFNMTTLRLTEPEVTALMSHEDYSLVTADLRDHFGDSGTVVYVQIHRQATVWVLENWLMSCRILGRTVEERLLDEISRVARTMGAQTIVGVYAPTKKNAPFADFYVKNGFVEAGTSEDGASRFIRRLSDWTAREAFVQIEQGGTGWT